MRTLKTIALAIAAMLLASGGISAKKIASAQAVNPRPTISLNGPQWHMMRDTAAVWENDRLYLPEEITDLSQLPVNPPTGGWEALSPAKSIKVSVPGTVEEYMTTSKRPSPDDFKGVSWWYTTVVLPESMKERRAVLHFESVRMRAEVYLDGKLVGYDIIGESPFDVDITDAVTPGKPQTLAVRVTNPGGNFHWQDFTQMRWGDYIIPPGRSFSGLIGRVRLDVVDPVYIEDVYMQNQPVATTAKAIVNVRNTSSKAVERTVGYTVSPKDATVAVPVAKGARKVKLQPGDNTVTLDIDVPDARLWDLSDPFLYRCDVTVADGKRLTDNDSRTFGFRWFAPEGIGDEAVLRLNGRRMMLRSAISWGYWPATGLHATPEMARKQISTAQSMGLNMLNFHRSIGSPVVLEQADSMGILYYEEPGAFHSADHDPFIRAIVNTKLQRMVKRDRSHPSLVIYNLINELGGVRAADTALMAKRRADLVKAHAIDPSRVMTLTSGWASNEQNEEDSKFHMRPFDPVPYFRGWYDNHRAGGPATWNDSYYRNLRDQLMYCDNHTEVYMRGEEGAISTPPRIAMIERTIDSTGVDGWDGAFWRDQAAAWHSYFKQKGLAAGFGNLDSLTRSLGDIQLYHQGRRIQGMRMENLGDAYVINGWESMPYDNHSGVVDNYRNCKGNLGTFTRFTAPLYVAVSPHTQFVRLPGSVDVDFHVVNEADLKGDYKLVVERVAPDGGKKRLYTRDVTVEGGDRFGQLLAEAVPLDIDGGDGLYTISATLTDASGKTVASGYEQVLGIVPDYTDLPGRGAIYGEPDDPVAQYYKSVTGKELPAYDPSMGKLDWLIVTRPALDEASPIPVKYFDNTDSPAFKVTWFKDNDISAPAGTATDNCLDRRFVGGAQPDPLIPANQEFSAIWEGTLVAPVSGNYLLGVHSDRGVRMEVNGQRIADDWGNKKDVTFTSPFYFEQGEKVNIMVQYRQTTPDGMVQLMWTMPGTSAIAPESIVDRAVSDGTTLLLLKSPESWMEFLNPTANIGYTENFTVGTDWVGGVHFVTDHPVLHGLPVNTAMNWPYQELVKNGNQRLGFKIADENFIAGAYRSWPFHLGTAMGEAPCGKGRVLYSTLRLTEPLSSPEPAAEPARKLFGNIIRWATPEGK